MWKGSIVISSACKRIIASYGNVLEPAQPPRWGLNPLPPGWETSGQTTRPPRLVILVWKCNWRCQNTWVCDVSLVTTIATVLWNWVKLEHKDRFLFLLPVETETVLRVLIWPSLNRLLPGFKIITTLIIGNCSKTHSHIV